MIRLDNKDADLKAAILSADENRPSFYARAAGRIDLRR
jgi:hypothetical protein